MKKSVNESLSTTSREETFVTIVQLSNNCQNNTITTITRKATELATIDINLGRNDTEIESTSLLGQNTYNVIHQVDPTNIIKECSVQWKKINNVNVNEQQRRCVAKLKLFNVAYVDMGTVQIRI